LKANRECLLRRLCLLACRFDCGIDLHQRQARMIEEMPCLALVNATPRTLRDSSSVPTVFEIANLTAQ